MVVVVIVVMVVVVGVRAMEGTSFTIHKLFYHRHDVVMKIRLGPLDAVITAE
jgi:hypothetical protein